MRRKDFSAMALAIAACFPGGAVGFEARLALADPASEETPDERKKKPGDGIAAGIPAAALIAAGVAAAAALASRGGGNDGGSAGGLNSSSGTFGDAGGTIGDGPGDSTAAPPNRTLAYTSAADFRTPEFSAQAGLAMVGADRLYYKGHHRWYLGEAPDPAAGTGIGVKIAIADTGINAREAATGSAIAIDTAASYDYVNDRPGSAADDALNGGHGTHVAGIIAAPKNGAGMHGLAYNASVVNFKVADSAGFVTASDAQLADMLSRARAAGAMIVSNSWSSPTPITQVSADDLRANIPRFIEASRAYVAGGGVVVFAAGNDKMADPGVQPGLPYHVPDVKPGWLAVVAVDGSGVLAVDYSNRCGVAADWCLAAPGGSPGTGLYSMSNEGGYVSMEGTSMAAPHAAAALAALKSMFPNLSYLQIRQRLLFTADRTGAYSDRSTYGQGLMDLDAASSPVGGIAVPTASSANGTTAQVEGSGIEFQAGALNALGMQRWVLVVDNYQRAPFWIPSQAFFREARPRLVDRQWASLRSDPQEGIGIGEARLRFSHSPGLNDVVSAGLAASRLGFAQGAGGEAVLGSHLELAWLPRLAAPGVDSVAMGYASDVGGLRIGLLGTVPGLKATGERTLESSSLGSRSALGFVAQHRAASTTFGVSLAAAEDFERPIGIAATGAFGLGESAAISSGGFVEQTLGASTVLRASFEVAQHRAETSGTLAAPAYAMRSAAIGARTRLGAKTVLSGDVKRDWSGGEAARLQVPLTIDENGAIGSVTYALPYDDLLGRSSFTLRLDHELSRRVALRAALTHERYGFGVSATGLAAVLAIEN